LNITENSLLFVGTYNAAKNKTIALNLLPSKEPPPKYKNQSHESFASSMLQLNLAEELSGKFVKRQTNN